MDRLRSPGGCPWDAEQTHASLAPYALEEAYELVEAIEVGSRDDLLEELGDMLLQVVFHARLAEEDPAAPFDIEAVANACADKLVERHPHVFADGDAQTAGEVSARWDEIKKSTKGRESVFDGVPVGQSALARAQKVASRAAKAGIEVPVDAGGAVGDALLEVAVRAQADGVDAEAALRAAVRRYEDAARFAERAATAASD